jgi:beta-lactamase regulating signal transducer with metallopeptidase domain
VLDSESLGAFIAPAVSDASINDSQMPIASGGRQSGLRVAIEHPRRGHTERERRAGAARSPLAMLSWSGIALAAYAAGSAGLAAWWLMGHVLLRRIIRKARPVVPDLHEIFRSISGPAGDGVLLLESGTVDLPFTFSWARPVIVLPTALCHSGDSQELRFCLAHEWSHIERRDARAWTLAAVAGFVLFYQPLFWWLRRQLRLCQDYLADDRAAALHSAEDYAMYLVRLARMHRSVIASPALGVSDRWSNLHRRVAMLVQDHDPLEHRCRMLWSVSAAVASSIVIVVASGLKLDGAPAAQQPKVEMKSALTEPPAQGKPIADSPKAETLSYTGKVKEIGTGKPISGATVVVRRSILKRNNENTTLEETKHITDANGKY